ncbi:MAG TPA: redoxin domain-containing protein [Candidatus Norongarragalinales archaeon]|jgi:thiol-disulfide isomerase/thioredoxin|nr:redoxin domain-containing protein [Candidatus Norongarragalinales archaeon]
MQNKWRVEGRLAPDITSSDWLNSKPLRLKDLHGKVVLVDFWTFGCIDCQRELPHVQKIHEKYAKKGLVVIGVHSPEFEYEKNIETVRKEVKKRKLTYPIAFDNEHRAWDSYLSHNWPTQYLIDKEGRIRWTHVGECDLDKIEQRIEQLLQENAPKNAAFQAPERTHRVVKRAVRKIVKIAKKKKR